MDGKRKRKSLKWLLSCLLLTAAVAAGIAHPTAAQGNERNDSFANVVVFVRFQDSQTDNFMEKTEEGSTVSRLERIKTYYFNTESRDCLISYLNDVSYGQFHLTNYLPQYDGQTIVPFTAAHDFSYYASSAGRDEELVNEVVDSGILAGLTENLDLYGDAKTKDGFLDNLTVILDVDGIPSANWGVYSASRKTDYAGTKKVVTAGGTYYVRSLNLINSYSAVNGSGTIFHEFMHSLGYPDLYTTNDFETPTMDRPVYKWDLMGYSATGTSYPLAYMRMRCTEWLTIKPINTDQEITLVPATQKNGNQAFILKTPLSDTEFFVIEYRIREYGGFRYETYLPGTGLIVYRINLNVYDLDNRTPDRNYGVWVHRYNDPAKNFTKAQLDNLEHSVFTAGDTIGNADLEKGADAGAITFSDGNNSGITIDGIKKNADGTMSCSVHFSSMGDLDAWEEEPSGLPAFTDDQIASVQAEDGSVYMVYNTANGYQVSRQVNGTWTTVDGLLGKGYAPSITMYRGNPAVSLMSTDYSSQLTYLYENGTWKKIPLSSSDGWNGAVIAGDDTGLSVGVLSASNALSIYDYDKASGSMKLRRENVVPASDYAADIHLIREGDTVYAGYRAFFNKNELKLSSVDAAGKVNTYKTGLNCGNLDMVQSAEGSLYLAAISSDMSSKEAYLYRFDKTALTRIGTYDAGSHIFSVCAGSYQGVPYLAAALDPSQKTEVVYLTENGNMERLGNYVSASNSGNSFLYFQEDVAKIIYVPTGKGSDLASHRMHALPKDGANTEPDQPQHTHTIVKDPAVTPTCTKAGKTEGSHCSECGEVIVAQKTIPAAGHKWDSGTVTKAATETAPGEKVYRCTVSGCGAEKKEAIPAITTSVPAVTVKYRTHVQTFGWQSYVSNGGVSGTSGQAKRLEGINISVSGNPNLGIQYTTHCQTYGWLGWSANGEMSGTEGEAKRLEAIKIQLTGNDKNLYDVYYRVHAQSYGWLGWAKNGEAAGTAGYAKRLEAIQIVIVKKGSSMNKTMGGIVSADARPYVAANGASAGNVFVPGADVPRITYRTHVQSFGWQTWKQNGDLSGTSGQAKRLEAIQIKLGNKMYSGNIEYRTHIQSIGWEAGWRSNGALSGTSGQAKRLEAIQIRLTGEMSTKYDVYYRVHAQSFGWLGWAKNGASSGTAGYAKRLEAIQIVLVPKGGAAPAGSGSAYISR